MQGCPSDEDIDSVAAQMETRKQEYQEPDFPYNTTAGANPPRLLRTSCSTGIASCCVEPHICTGFVTIPETCVSDTMHVHPLCSAPIDTHKEAR